MSLTNFTETRNRAGRSGAVRMPFLHKSDNALPEAP